METNGYRMNGTFRARGLRAWLAALVLLSGCVNTAELTPAIDPSPSHRPPRQASTAFDSPEFQANEPVAQRDVDGRSRAHVLEDYCVCLVNVDH